MLSSTDSPSESEVPAVTFSGWLSDFALPYWCCVELLKDYRTSWITPVLI